MKKGEDESVDRIVLGFSDMHGAVMELDLSREKEK
jgi:hypothetical protein